MPSVVVVVMVVVVAGHVWAVTAKRERCGPGLIIPLFVWSQ